MVSLAAPRCSLNYKLSGLSVLPIVAAAACASCGARNRYWTNTGLDCVWGSATACQGRQTTKVNPIEAACLLLHACHYANRACCTAVGGISPPSPPLHKLAKETDYLFCQLSSCASILMPPFDPECLAQHSEPMSPLSIASCLAVNGPISSSSHCHLHSNVDMAEPSNRATCCAWSLA